MTINFDNPVTAGTVLVRSAIQSPNFIHLVAGWIISQDGSAEFNNLSIRGTFFGSNYIINSQGIFLYAGVPAAGNLIISLAATSGTDSFGNFFPAGLNVSGGGLINVPSGNALDTVFTSEVYGDAFARLNFLVGGTMTWGSGSAPADVNLYRSQTGQIQTDNTFGANMMKVNTFIAKEISGNNATWQTPALNSGWTVAAAAIRNAAPLKYRIDSEDRVWFRGAVATTTATPSGSVTTVVAPYIPVAAWDLQQDLLNQLASTGIQKGVGHLFLSAGNLSLNGFTIASGDIFTFNHSFTLGNQA